MKNLLREILEHNRHRTSGPYLWPALIGPTGSGKTSVVRELAQEMGLEVRTLLLGTMLPEDVLGLPRVIDGATRWTLPEWAVGLAERPAIVFLDEIDKARPDVAATVLTLLAERRIRDTILHPGVLFVAAGQPVWDGWLGDETNRALSARLVWLPVGYDWGFVEAKHGLRAGALGFLPKGKAPRPPVLPEPSARQVDWALGFLRETRLEEEELMAVLRGVMPPEHAEALYRAWKDAAALRVEDVAASLEPEDIWGIPFERLAELMGPLMTHGKLETWCEAVVKLWGDAPPEVCSAALEKQYNWLVDHLVDNEVEVFGPEVDEEAFEKAFRIAIRRAIVRQVMHGTPVEESARPYIEAWQKEYGPDGRWGREVSNGA